VTEKENEVAQKVAERLGLWAQPAVMPITCRPLGSWVTIFEKSLQTEEDFIEELRPAHFTFGTAR